MNFPFSFKKVPLTRIKKYAKYRRMILRMDAHPGRWQSPPAEKVQGSLPQAIILLMWLLGGIVIILLILVSALVYFGR